MGIGFQVADRSHQHACLVGPVISGGMKHCWLWGIEKTVGDAVFKDRNEVRRHTSAVPGIGQSELSAIWRTKIMGAMKSPMLLGLGGMAAPLPMLLVRGPCRSHRDGLLCRLGRVVGVVP